MPEQQLASLTQRSNRDCAALENYRILNCITGLNIGGAEFMLARFARSLRNTAYDARVLSLMPPGPVVTMLDEDGVQVASLDMSESRPSARALARLRPVVRNSGCDVLHGWMYHGNVAASLGAYLDRKQPVIWSIHHSVDDIAAEKRLTRYLIRLLAWMSGSTSAISYCSRISAAQHEALGFDPAKRVVIPNGIDCNEFKPRAGARERLCAAFGIPTERLILGNVARAHPMKNHEAFVRTLARLREDGHDVHGVIVGAGHEEGAARRMARTLGIDHRLATPGPRPDVAELLPGLDVFVLSSAWGEAFPLSVAEAMASGVPAVATDVGDCSWLVGDNTMISKPKEPDAQAAVLRRIFELSPSERRGLGLMARARIIENFSLRKYTDSHIGLYETALADRLRTRSMR